MIFKAASKVSSLDAMFYEFSIEDCPVLLTGTSLILQGVPNSPILDYQTMMRGDRATGIFEGDYIWQGDEFLGIVIYKDGFVLQTLQNKLKDLPSLEHIQVVKGSRVSCRYVVKSPLRQPILFKYKSSSFDLGGFIATSEGNLLTVGTKAWVRPDEVKVCSGVTDSEGLPLGIGDLYQGGIIELHNLQVCLRLLDGKYINLRRRN